MSWLYTLIVIVLAMLAIPLVAMQFTDEVVWTASDFMLAALLLFGAGSMLRFVWTRANLRSSHRSLLLGLIVIGLLLLWAELAVGLFT